MITKPKYNINVKSNQPWSPYKGGEKCINNRGSVGHNIISHEPNIHTPGVVLGIFDR
jgi:hypothetical protein